MGASPYYRVLDPWSDFGEYNSIWNCTGTSIAYIGSNGIVYGTTRNQNGSAGFIQYLSSKGKAASQSTTAAKPSFSDFMNSINNSNPCLMTASLMDANGNIEGHAMFVEGYIVAANKDDLSGLRILQVFDGWYDGVRYINYDFDRYMSFGGTFFAD